MIAGRAGGVGVAILGPGAVAELHAEALRAAGARLLAVHGPDPEATARFAREHGIGSVASSPQAAVVTDGVEVVLVASPSPVHAEQARLALEHGRHVLVEIPLALSLSDGEAVVSLAAARGLLLGVCHTLRFWEPHRAMREALAASGSPVLGVVARHLMLRRSNVGWSGRRRSWTDDLLWHHGGHVIDLVLSLLGADPVGVAAVAGPAHGGPARPLDYAIALRTAAGGVASVSLSYTARLPVSDVVVSTEAETWEVSGTVARSSREILWTGEPEDAQRAAISAQDAAFLAAVGGGPVFPSEARTILPALRVQEEVAGLVRGVVPAAPAPGRDE